MKPYQPVSCDIHSHYELLIIRGSRLSLCYLDNNDSRQHINGLPVNLTASKGEEFIIIRSDINTEITVRLDRIISCQYE